MALELVYTSAARGLRAGTSGFCTVAMTKGMPPALVPRLEALGGYRPGPSGDGPEAFCFWRVETATGIAHVLSVVGPAPPDHTARTNKIATYLVLSPEELAPAGPAAMIARAGLLRRSWTGAPAWIEEPVRVPLDGDASLRACAAWQRACGDAGWAGVLASAFLRDQSKPIHVIYRAGTDPLPLVDEAIRLLPDWVRWRATFSTYFLQPVAGTPCAWRFCLEGTAAADAARQSKGLVIDLTRPLDAAPDSRFVRMARTGVDEEAVAQRAKAKVGAAPRAKGAAAPAPAGIELEPDLDPLPAAPAPGRPTRAPAPRPSVEVTVEPEPSVKPTAVALVAAALTIVILGVIAIVVFTAGNGNAPATAPTEAPAVPAPEVPVPAPRPVDGGASAPAAQPRESNPPEGFGNVPPASEPSADEAQKPQPQERQPAPLPPPPPESAPDAPSPDTPPEAESNREPARAAEGDAPAAVEQPGSAPAAPAVPVAPSPAPAMVPSVFVAIERAPNAAFALRGRAGQLPPGVRSARLVPGHALRFAGIDVPEKAELVLAGQAIRATVAVDGGQLQLIGYASGAAPVPLVQALGFAAGSTPTAAEVLERALMRCGIDLLDAAGSVVARAQLRPRRSDQIVVDGPRRVELADLGDGPIEVTLLAPGGAAQPARAVANFATEKLAVGSVAELTVNRGVQSGAALLTAERADGSESARISEVSAQLGEASSLKRACDAVRAFVGGSAPGKDFDASVSLVLRATTADERTALSLPDETVTVTDRALLSKMVDAVEPRARSRVDALSAELRSLQAPAKGGVPPKWRVRVTDEDGLLLLEADVVAPKGARP